MDDLESKLHQKLLEGLIEHMQGRMGDDLAAKFPQKGLEVSVAAPDKDSLSDGLAKAKDITDSDGDSDEDRLMAALGDDDDDDEDK